MNARRSGRPSRTPDHLPTLQPGTHLSPADGACFMEYASVLAGLPWSDRPRCTHPVLSTLARVVNDESSPEGRGHLTILVPSVVGLRGDQRAAPALVAAVCEAARRHQLPAQVTDSHSYRALRRLTRLHATPATGRLLRGLRWLSDAAYQRGPATRALVALARAAGKLPEPSRDRLLRDMLVAGIGAVDTQRVEPARLTNGQRARQDCHRIDRR
jgi:hypothetical protein